MTKKQLLEFRREDARRKGKASVRSRHRGKTKEEISRYYRSIALKRWSRSS